MGKTAKIGDIDPAMAFFSKNTDGMDWYGADNASFELNGLYWRKPGEPFRRIPQQASISDGVDFLAYNTAGVMLRFQTDAPEIRIHVKTSHNNRVDHMTAVGSMGFDLYLGSGTGKVYCRSTRFDQSKDEYTVTVYGPAATSKKREFTLNFPLYAGVDEFKIGFTTGAEIKLPSPWSNPHPIVVYGTSIQQGGCASRPGMCHTNQMSRLLNRPFLNFGFSGCGNGEKSMAELLAEIQNPAMYVLDYDANAGVERLRTTLPVFIDVLRKAHPATPILLVSRLLYAREAEDLPEYAKERLDLTRIHLTELERRREAGDTNIHFLDGSSLYGPDPLECTVDGAHATDLGFYQIARRMAPVIERILQRQPCS